MKVTQKKVVKLVTEVQYEAGDVLVCTKSDSAYLDVGSHYIVLYANYEEDVDMIRLTDNMTSTVWTARMFNDTNATCKFDFELSVKGSGDLN
jgi:hypothetical protein